MNATIPIIAPTLAADTAATATRGATLPCPCCGEANATITLNLADGESLACQDCSADFSTADVRNFIAKWAPMLAWVDAMPTA